jgi:hypothetical protein
MGQPPPAKIGRPARNFLQLFGRAIGTIAHLLKLAHRLCPALLRDNTIFVRRISKSVATRPFRRNIILTAACVR